jgi:nucleoside-diphosphate-sugar epimerase
MNILLTGATGFIGRAVAERLARESSDTVTTAGRTKPERDAGTHVEISDIGPQTNWHAALTGVDAVIHMAARVHMMRDTDPFPEHAFRRVNVEGTVNLARQAAEAGARRFVFVSSIKVNGENTAKGRPFRADDRPHPKDLYGLSKLAAEDGLRTLAAIGLEPVIVRPPLVYGPNVGANFLAMMRWVNRGIPLPLGGLDNLRSLIAVENLADLLVACARHPQAAGKTLLASDGEDLSTTDLLRRLGHALGRPARLIAAPPSMLRLGAKMLGKQSLYARLCGSLQIDSSATERLLGWRPVVSVDEGLHRTAEQFLRSTRS